MPNWAAPTLNTLVASLKMVLRDEDTPEVFTTPMCAQFIDDALNELNQIRPREVIGLIDATTDLTSELLARLDDIWMMQLVDPQGRTSLIPASDGATGGWLYWGKRASFDGDTFLNLKPYLDHATQNWVVRWYGYQYRDMTPASGTAFVDLDSAEDEFLVLRYGRWAGMRSLNADRALYQQWVQQTNNTDVSPTQLNQMTGLAEQEWLQLRKRMTRLRRVPVGAT